MKLLDVRDLISGVKLTSDKLSILKEQIKQVQTAIEEIITLEDTFKGEGGQSIRTFYQECHLPLLLSFESLIDDYQSYLNSLVSSLHNFEPSPTGVLRQEFLEHELEQGLSNAIGITAELTEEANRITMAVSDIVHLPQLNENRFKEATNLAKHTARETVEKLSILDYEQTVALNPLLNELNLMEQYIQKIANMFQGDDLSLSSYQPKTLNWKDSLKELSNLNPESELNTLQDITKGAIEGAAKAVGDTWEGLKSTYKLGRTIMGPFSPLFLGSELLFNRDQLLENQRQHQEFYLRLINDPVGKVRQVLDMPKYIWSAVSTAWVRDVVNGDAKSRTAFFTYGLTTLGIGILGDKGIGKSGTIAQAVGQGVKGISNTIRTTPPVMAGGLSQPIVPYNVFHNPLFKIKKFTEEEFKTKVSTKRIENDNYFVGTLKGDKVHLKGVKVEEIIYTKRLPEETAKLRRTFNNSVKKSFLKTFANDPLRVEYLRKAGLNDTDIARMKDGLNPKGWQVHHNLPLDDGGTNDFTNLVLIKNDPYHKTVTNEQNSLTRELAPTQSKKINWPMFEDEVYPPKPF
ncbi:T7SS effector LXG polymorphic toxin [Cytobacillus pseudoceanisediminis]|uniref:T7SS effector LXG polymorphic toxin n=1 Tax=Cytobacillus pseudoceanisediminis TaxID=3051614 RepID=UPI003659EB8E